MVMPRAPMSRVHFHGVAERRQIVHRSPILQHVADHLARHLDPLRRGELYVPEQKALLSCDGGVCPADGSRLTFDPLSPNDHMCPACHSRYQGDRHHRAWIWRYHLWLSERAVHFALLGALDRDEDGFARAFAIAEAYAERYCHYPNRDNVLGPTRPFFSTYLESVWLTQLVIALELARASGHAPSTEVAHKLENMIDESASLIGSFDEWWSNRQVWNNVALIAAGRYLEDASLVTRGFSASHGLTAQLKRAVSADGRWVEGENYHLFALRGFLLGAALLEEGGIDLYAAPATSRLGRMFSAPLSTILPDLTLPARGDAPYGVSVLQPRFAELWEIGWARTDDPRLESLLGDMYGADVPDGPDVGLMEIAELETNRPPSRVRRDRLGWKALLWMRPELPAADPRAWRSGSVIVSAEGPVVLRPDHARYLALECTGCADGHGHPDALHLTLFDRRPWFQDFGTGSYVSPTLHWFRSALCHNAPALAGIGQRQARGWCSAFDQVGRWMWARGSAPEIFGPQYTASRTLIAGPEYVVDMISLAAPDDSVVDLPIHPLGAVTVPEDVALHPTGGLEIYGATAHESGYDGIERAMLASHVPSSVIVHGEAGEAMAIYMAPREDEQLFIARAPGPPTLAFGETGALDFLVRRAAGSGRWVQVYSTIQGAVDGVEVEGEEVRVIARHGVDRFQSVTHGLDVALADGTVLHLSGILPQPGHRISGPQHQPIRLRCALLDHEVAFHDAFERLPPTAVVSLGALSYRRSEDDYPGEGAFSARVGLGAFDTSIYVAIDVLKSDLVLRDHDAPLLHLDNETSDIHADGVQCYFAWDAWSGYLVLPQSHEPEVRVHEVGGTSARPGRLRGAWARTPTGYRMVLSYDVGERITPGREFPVNVVVNEMREGRTRRAGQLALAGGGGWVYLRGDRESESEAAVAVVQ